MIFSVFQKNWVFGYSWSILLWYRCYYPHRLRDALSPVCGIFCSEHTLFCWRKLFGAIKDPLCHDYVCKIINVFVKMKWMRFKLCQFDLYWVLGWMLHAKRFYVYFFLIMYMFCCCNVVFFPVFYALFGVKLINLK